MNVAPPLAATSTVQEARETPVKSPPSDASGLSYAILNSCVKYVRTRIPELPLMKTPDDLEPNTPIFIGAAALFRYPTEAHIAFVAGPLEETCFWVDETNYSHGKFTRRCVDYHDPSLRGFWRPSSVY